VLTAYGWIKPGYFLTLSEIVMLARANGSMVVLVLGVDADDDFSLICS
jgi:hypothetical protein